MNYKSIIGNKKLTLAPENRFILFLIRYCPFTGNILLNTQFCFQIYNTKASGNTPITGIGMIQNEPNKY